MNEEKGSIFKSFTEFPKRRINEIRERLAAFHELTGEEKARRIKEYR